MPRFAIETTGPDRCAASGELTFETAANALRTGTELLTRDRASVLDLSRVESGDSAGVAVLVEWLAVAQEAGQSLRFEGIPAQMLAIARISDLEDLLLGR